MCRICRRFRSKGTSASSGTKLLLSSEACVPSYPDQLYKLTRVSTLDSLLSLWEKLEGG